MNILTQDHNGFRYEVIDLAMAGGPYWQCRIRIARTKEEGAPPFCKQFTEDMRWLHHCPEKAIAASEQIARDLIDVTLPGLKTR